MFIQNPSPFLNIKGPFRKKSTTLSYLRRTVKEHVWSPNLSPPALGIELRVSEEYHSDKVLFCRSANDILGKYKTHASD